MAPINLYDSTISLYDKAFSSLIAVLEKAKLETPEKVAALPSARLIDDMLPLTMQVAIASSIAKKTIERLLPARAPLRVWADDEKTLDELINRAKETQELLATVSREDLDGLEDNDVQLAMGKVTVDTTAYGYVFGYSLPNIFFHVSTAYAILRKEGVPVGKLDYLVPFLSPYKKSEA
ncbi:hypothetical protein B0H67DRAFT_481235 [Lasiosphaeris hirsuta]|uniref:DUF1993 domain-containing protein n=1 Tax=Lasiosphaeris hirsuta TaxID=260670 RepID=A0AA40AYP9_9PEZI|nr:hypothetical protein B0H67DRAFT_481235 [Lasiosphaeris hirsuta]